MCPQLSTAAWQRAYWNSPWSELVTEVRSVTEWHRRMTRENLNQSGGVVNLEKFVIGAEIYFYKPPTAQDVKWKGRKAKHLDHYVGPARITKKIIRRQVVSDSLQNRMVIRSEYFREKQECLSWRRRWETSLLQKLNLSSMLFAGRLPVKGEMVIMKDFPESNDW